MLAQYELPPVTELLPETLVRALRLELVKSGCALARANPEEIKDSLIALAHRLGRVRPARRAQGFLDVLTALHSTMAPSNSLSSRYGLGMFPFHTDDAVDECPARWLLLADYHCASSALTNLVDGKRLLASNESAVAREAREAPFFVVNGRKSFMTTLVSSAAGSIRWDFDAMRPATPRAERLREALVSATEGAEHISCPWSPGTILIVDNHRMLHARGQVGVESTSGARALLRALVQEGH